MTKLLVMLDNEETPFPQDILFRFHTKSLCLRKYHSKTARIKRRLPLHLRFLQSRLIDRFEVLVHYAGQPSKVKHETLVRRRQEVFPKPQGSKVRHSAARVACWTCQMNYLLPVVEA